jgi:hypothetical protein
MIGKLLEKQKVDYAIFEVSPVFNDTYPGLTARILEQGYSLYQLPGNNWERNEEFTKDPLGAVKEYCEIKQRGIELTAYIDSISQENFLFIRSGL